MNININNGRARRQARRRMHRANVAELICRVRHQKDGANPLDLRALKAARFYRANERKCHAKGALF